MRIDSIQGAGTIGTTAPLASPRSAEAVDSGFGNIIKNVLESVNDAQNQADTATQQLALGEVEDIHQVMLALEQANLAFGLTVQVRNKGIEAYQEIMRMQV